MSSNPPTNCSRCGAPLMPGARFCSQCDAPVSPSANVPSSVTGGSSGAQWPWMVAGAAVGVLILVIVVGAVMWYQSNSATKESESALVLGTATATGTFTATPTVENTAQPTALPEIPTATYIPSPTATVTLPPTVAPLPTETALPPPVACVNNAAFVADVTIPDGTVLAAGQSFVKTWRLQNSGNCAWDNSFSFMFTGGDLMSGASPQAVIPVGSRAVVDIPVRMIAPTQPGVHTGHWQMRGPDGTFFGTTVTVVIVVPSPATAVPTPIPTDIPAPVSETCWGKPNIAYFKASPTTITAGDSSTLSWGAVTNATSAYLSPDVGGVASPGSVEVSPGNTTTYTLTATCGEDGSTRIARVTVTVNAPTIHSQGNLSIPQTFTANLDTGVVGGGGGDIWFEARTATQRFVTPRNGAEIAKFGATAPGRGDCTSAPLSENSININNLPQGTYVCVLTNAGRYGRFRVTAPVGPSPGTLKISYTTWD